jgi:catechol 2,3-dioxygenase-like lactoylglutathione lyase family enzyme
MESHRSLATSQQSSHDSWMPQAAGVSSYNIIAFATIVDVERAKSFYRDTLGLALLSEEPPFALVFNAKGIMIRLGMAKKVPQGVGTVLGWQVPDALTAVKDLQQAGVAFERFEGLPQDELGIWTSPTGAKVAWFKDPDGNILSISEHPELKSPELKS